MSINSALYLYVFFLSMRKDSHTCFVSNTISSSLVLTLTLWCSWDKSNVFSIVRTSLVFLSLCLLHLGSALVPWLGGFFEKEKMRDGEEEKQGMSCRQWSSHRTLLKQDDGQQVLSLSPSLWLPLPLSRSPSCSLCFFLSLSLSHSLGPTLSLSLSPCLSLSKCW